MLHRYRLYRADGTEAGEAHYAVRIKPDEIVWGSGNRKLRVRDVVPINDGSPFGLLKLKDA